VAEIGEARRPHALDRTAIGREREVEPQMLRAAGQWLAAGRIVSGGSTLSMQVARLVEPRAGRSLGAKLRQMTPE
jgi:hypothetical protein